MFFSLKRIALSIGLIFETYNMLNDGSTAQFNDAFVTFRIRSKSLYVSNQTILYFKNNPLYISSALFPVYSIPMSTVSLTYWFCPNITLYLELDSR